MRHTHTECVSESESKNERERELEREREKERANHIEGRKREKKEAKNWYIPRAREYKTLTANDQDDITIRRQIQRARFVIFYYVWTLFSFTLSRSHTHTQTHSLSPSFSSEQYYLSLNQTVSLACSLTPSFTLSNLKFELLNERKCTILSKSNRNEEKNKEE